MWSKMASVSSQDRLLDVPKGSIVCTRDWTTRSLNVATNNTVTLALNHPTQHANLVHTHSFSTAARVVSTGLNFSGCLYCRNGWQAETRYIWGQGEGNNSKDLIKGHLKKAKEITQPICKPHTGNEWVL